jgi:hypothetical protein
MEGEIMRITFKENKSFYYPYECDSDGFEAPKCRICEKYMKINKMKFRYAWMFCEDHEDEAMLGVDGRIEYFCDLEVLIAIQRECDNEVV